MTTPLAELQAENERLRRRVADLEQMLPEAKRPADAPPQSTDHSPQIEVLGVPIEWQLDAGTCTFQGAAVATMFVNPTLAGLMAGFQKMVGTERFFLAMQSEGRKNIDIDWQIITSQPTFEQGFDAWSRFPILAGWGRWEIVSLDMQRKECRIRVHNSFEGLYQQALGVCWGSGVAAGKCAGIFSLLFETNCWAEQVEYLARGDTYDSFLIRPSERSLEAELDNLLSSDTATRADLAVALQQLQQEIEQRGQAEEERAALQQQIIDAQRNALRELSTPLIPVSDNVVIMPLIGTIDSGRAQQVMEALLEGVAHYQSELAILDITGVPVVDTQVAQALVSAARAVRLLGARVMLTGIQPQIAQTLVQLGVDLSGISTHGSLQAGIRTALER
jgi:rsbT co-antagonist protein RsbR